MADDKAKLLRSLEIDRSSGETAGAAGRRRWPALAAGSALVLAAMAAVAFYVPGFRGIVGIEPTIPQQSVATSPPPAAPPPSAAAAEPRRPGTLAASGYVVA